MPLIQSALRADIGGRQDQEDAQLADEALGLFAIADGMGASVSGRPAADLAIATLRAQYADTAAARHNDEQRRMTDAILAANNAVSAKANQAARYWEERQKSLVDFDGELARWLGMGTTLVALRLNEGSAYVAHVGDSRAYHFHDGVLRQLTVDDRLQDDARKAGLPESEIQKLPAKVIVRALGIRMNVEAEAQRLTAAPGDIFLLSSDGLTDAVSNAEIEDALRRHTPSLTKAADELVATALARGSETSYDNVSVILVRVA